MCVKLPDKSGTRTFSEEIDIERVLIQFEEMVEMYDIRVVQQVDCFPPISLPINTAGERSISVCIRLQDDQLRSDPRMPVQGIDDPNGTSSQGRQRDMSNKHNESLT
jgi:hypothetical protein